MFFGVDFFRAPLVSDVFFFPAGFNLVDIIRPSSERRWQQWIADVCRYSHNVPSVVASTNSTLNVAPLKLNAKNLSHFASIRMVLFWLDADDEVAD